MANDKIGLHVELGEAVKTFIERMSMAVEGIAKPFQMKRIAKAAVDVRRIEAEGSIALSELEERAFRRQLRLAVIKETNFEAIVEKAAKLLEANAEPDKLEDDWLMRAASKFETVSNPEMQELWAKLLAQQANKPHSFSKRTLDIVDQLSRIDADRFTRLCSFNVNLGNLYNRVLIVFDPQHHIYSSEQLHFSVLTELQALGLIRYEPGSQLQVQVDPEYGRPIWYFGKFYRIRIAPGSHSQVRIGGVSFTQSGLELLRICGAEPREGFIDYLRQQFKSQRFEFDEIPESEQPPQDRWDFRPKD